MKNKNVELYEPHSGIGGAVIPLPLKMKDVANELSGKIMSLENIIEKLSPIAKEERGKVEIVEKFKFIKFYIEYPESAPYAMHLWCLIKYKEMEKEQ